MAQPGFLYGPAFPVATNDDNWQEGDSISSLNTSTQMPMLVKRRWVAKCESRPGVARGSWVNTAVSATGVVASLARINAGLGSKYFPSKFIAVYGTADAILSTSVATFKTNFNLILDAICGNGIPAYIVGPMAVGEKWPSGQNPADIFIDGYIAEMIAGQLRYPTLCTFRDMRASVYAAQEPLLNLPAPGATIGPLTRPDGTGAHHNAGGRILCDYFVNGDVTITDAVTPAAVTTPTPAMNATLVSWLHADDVPAAGGANVTSWINRVRQIGTNAVGSMDLTITPATKPVMARPMAAGKANGKPAVSAVGLATYMQSAALLTAPIAQPLMLAMTWLQTDLAGNKIISDSTIATSFNVPTINASGLFQPAAPTPFNPSPVQAVIAGSINCAIVVFNGAYSFSVLNGMRSNMGQVGTNPIDRRFLFASATGPGGLPFNGMIQQERIYKGATFNDLPRWQDVYADIVAELGAFPQ